MRISVTTCAKRAAAVCFLICALAGAREEARAQAPNVFPQVIKIRYEAKDPVAGGHFIVWVEREKIWYGLDQRLYPAAKSVEVTHITPSPGSPTTTLIAVTNIHGGTPDYFHLTGNVRFRTTGMTVTSTNMP